MKIPFDVYDFFGYLASGFVLLVGMELVFGFPEVLLADLTVVQGGLILLGAYVAGHGVATPAKAFLEGVIVHRVLGEPTAHLLFPRRPRLRLLLPGYFKPLPEEIRRRLLEQLGSSTEAQDPQELFFKARFSPSVQESQAAMGRLSKFLAQYGFARNLTFTLLLVGAALLFSAYLRQNPLMLRHGVVVLIAAVLLFYRYLKFYRQYAFETLLTYLDSREEKPHGSTDQP